MNFELAHALTVAKFVAHFRRNSLEVELEPELFIRTERRHPDFRIRCDGVWVYVEVVCPGLSEEARSIYKTLGRIANMNRKMRMDRVAEVYLFKDPSEPEIDQIIDKCTLMAENDLQPQECIFKNTAQLFTNPWNQERLPTFPPAIDEKRPILVLVARAPFVLQYCISFFLAIFCKYTSCHCQIQRMCVQHHCVHRISAGPESPLPSQVLQGP